MLRMGSHGSEVQALQLALRRFEPHLATDGVYGANTERAVRFGSTPAELVPTGWYSGSENDGGVILGIATR
jgi:peptidoglycan hydrolase-like protein with peptidoglycan-binding domain